MSLKRGTFQVYPEHPVFQKPHFLLVAHSQLANASSTAYRNYLSSGLEDDAEANIPLSFAFQISPTPDARHSKSASQSDEGNKDSLVWRAAALSVVLSRLPSGYIPVLHLEDEGKVSAHRHHCTPHTTLPSRSPVHFIRERICGRHCSIPASAPTP
jgi:hypothetical protein